MDKRIEELINFTKEKYSCQHRIKNPQNQRNKIPHSSNSAAGGSGKIPAFFLASIRYDSPLILKVTE